VFFQQRFIGEILVAQCAKEADLVEKIDRILESGWLISDKVLSWQEAGKLDLLWRTPGGPIGWDEARLAARRPAEASSTRSHRASPRTTTRCL